MMTTPPTVQAELDGEFARSHHSSNLINVPPHVLGSCQFNDEPVALHIAGVREFNRGAFEMFAEAETPAEAADAFENYMHAAFGIDPEQSGVSVPAICVCCAAGPTMPTVPRAPC